MRSAIPYTSTFIVIVIIMSLLILTQIKQGHAFIRYQYHVLQRGIQSKTKRFSTNKPSIVDYKGFGFNILKTASNSKARLSVITTPHGVVECPNFIFCGTKAAMKGITTDQLKAEGSQIMLSNTYHLMINPGEDIVHRAGGLHKFMNWNGPILTDSGGYQIFSMGHGSVSDEIKGRRYLQTKGDDSSDNSTDPSPLQSLIKIDENGATFRSIKDGRIYTLTPESSIDIQHKLGADIILVLDECTPFHVTREYTENSMDRSHRWAARSLQQFVAKNCMLSQALYGIVQGGIYKDLRVTSCEFVNNQPFFGAAIGGSLGGSKSDMYDVVSFTRSQLRDDRPVHLLGIGGVSDIFHGVRQGIDTFDCVYPTRLARHGGAMVMARIWDEPECKESRVTAMTLPNLKKIKDRAMANALKVLRQRALTDSSSYAEKIPDKMLQKYYRKQFESLMESFERELLAAHEKKVANQGRKQKRQPKEFIRITGSKMSADMRPIDSSCSCYTCKSYSRAYLHHLFSQDEMLGPTLLTIHNVHFMNQLMADIRHGIETNTLDSIEKNYIHRDLVAEDKT